MTKLIDQLLKFCQARDWQQFHKPSNLAKSLVIESAELLEHFQWQDSFDNLSEIKQEIADIYIYLLLLSHNLKLDLEEIGLQKLAINEKKISYFFIKGQCSKIY